MEFKIKWLPHGVGLPLPSFATPGSAGMDVCSAVEILITPRSRKLIPLGFCCEIPEGYEAQLRPRSGLADKQGITVLNAPGTIDSDYRDEMKALLINHGDGDVIIQRGDRIAQLVIAPVLGKRNVSIVEVIELTKTARTGGYGSTGK